MVSTLKKIKSTVAWNAVNIPGWRTGRRIIVIESDDWGSIRMPSHEIYSEFISSGFNLTDTAYNRIDTLESNEDLIMLFDVLRSFRDRNGRHPVMTANTIVGNPDFKKIKDSDFSSYYYEPVTETFQRYPGRDKVEELWKYGNQEGFFHHQFHGREHVNIPRWMNALREKSAAIMLAFDRETTFSGNGDYNFMEVLDSNVSSELALMHASLADGLNLFRKIFGYSSKSFIPPCYAWNSEIEKTLSDNGVRYIQGLVTQSVPTGIFDQYGQKYHFLGSRNQYGQYFLMRNCFFEPALSRMDDPVGECLRRINIAFKWNKPATICTHRINFMGDLDPGNRRKNLALFKELLQHILKLWPDANFMTSDEVGDIISGNFDSDRDKKNLKSDSSDESLGYSN